MEVWAGEGPWREEERSQQPLRSPHRSWWPVALLSPGYRPSLRGEGSTSWTSALLVLLIRQDCSGAGGHGAVR